MGVCVGVCVCVLKRHPPVALQLCLLCTFVEPVSEQRTYLRRSLCIPYLLACQVKVTVGNRTFGGVYASCIYSHAR